MASEKGQNSAQDRAQLQRELSRLLHAEARATATLSDRETPAAAKRDPRTQRWLLAGALVLLATSSYFIWRHFYRPGISYQTTEKRPLLVSDQKEFHDAQLGLRFTPPPKWSMQLQTTEATGDHRPDRMVVKYKRVLPKLSAAWFRVEVADAPAGEDVGESLAKRQAGKDWKSKGDVSTTTVSGLPAAKILYGGTYDGFPSLREIVAVRRGGQVFYFVSTYQFADKQAQEQTRQTLQTVLFDQR